MGKWNYRKWNHINGGTILIDCPWIILGENLKDLEEEKSVYNPIFEKKKIKSEKYYVYVSLRVYRENSGKTKTGLFMGLTISGD